MLNDGAADGVDPLLLLLIGVGDEVHGVLAGGGELESTGLVDDVLGTLDGQAGAHRDDATWDGGPGDVAVLEPEELALLEDEPAAAPGLDVVALLGQPPGSLRVRPELHPAVVLRAGVLTRRRSPQTLHFLSKQTKQNKKKTF